MGPADDIIINKSIPTKSSGKGCIVVLFFLLLITLVGACGAYYWYTNMYETPKAAFFKYIGQTNIPEILDTEIYYNILEKINDEPYQTTTTVNLSTTKENEFTENVDVGKFDFSLDIKSNKIDEKSLVDFNIKYLDNDFFDLKYLSNRENMAIGSTEILEKYVATSKNNLSNSLNRTVGLKQEVTSDTVTDGMKQFADNRINISDEYRTKKANEYLTTILEKVPENAVELVEASPITINKNIINTDAYTLTLDANTYGTIATEVLRKLENDTELLNKLVTGVEKEEKVIEEEETEILDAPKPLTIESIEGETVEHNTEREVEAEDILLDDIEVTEENAEENVNEEAVFDVNANTTVDFSEFFNKDEDAVSVKEEKNIFEEIMLAMLFNHKLDMSVNQLQNKISEEIGKINVTEGITVTLYVKNVEGEDRETIKIVVKLPEKANLDIEYPSKSKVKITFLKDGKEINEEGQEITVKDKGTSFEIERTNADVQTKFNIVLNYIKEKQVVKKIQIDLTTQGSKSSKTYTNEAIIKYNDNEGDYKINIKNNINFQNVNIDADLNEENAIFIDQLSDEEVANLFSSVVQKTMDLYSEKILNLYFINTNSKDGLIEQPDAVKSGNEQPSVTRDPASQTDNPVSIGGDTDDNALITKEEAKNLLIGKIEAMMAEAEDNGTEFNLQSLTELPDQLQGHKLSSIISEEQAKITIAGYTFYIDADFMLTEE